MKLYFHNQTDEPIWVCTMFLSKDTCGDAGGWGTRGWWFLNPRDDVYVLDTDNNYVYFYAHSARGLVWAGPYGNVYVHRTPFDSCLDIGDNNPDTRVVHMQEIYLDHGDHRVNLVV